MFDPLTGLKACWWLWVALSLGTSAADRPAEQVVDRNHKGPSGVVQTWAELLDVLVIMRLDGYALATSGSRLRLDSHISQTF